jgi:hypothetical protein
VDLSEGDPAPYTPTRHQYVTGPGAQKEPPDDIKISDYRSLAPHVADRTLTDDMLPEIIESLVRAELTRVLAAAASL